MNAWTFAYWYHTWGWLVCAAIVAVIAAYIFSEIRDFLKMKRRKRK
jgi:hypothetical protein